MNQFKSAWQFAYTHWQFLAVLAFPVFLVEVITAYYLTDAALLMEAGNLDDITMYFEANSLPITLLSFISIILSISFTGGAFIAFNALTEGQEIKPFDALLTVVFTLLLIEFINRFLAFWYLCWNILKSFGIIFIFNY